MIIDYERNYKLYKETLPLLEKGFQFIHSLKNKPVGRYEQDDMFAIVQEGVTGSIWEKKMEAHKNYIDVQYMVSGQEVMEWENVEQLQQETPYDVKNDIIFYSGSGAVISVKAGMFYIAFPEDGHKPCGHISEVTSYRKIVLKLKYI